MQGSVRDDLLKSTRFKMMEQRSAPPSIELSSFIDEQIKSSLRVSHYLVGEIEAIGMCPSCIIRMEAWLRYRMSQARLELHEVAHPGVALVESAHSQAGGGRPKRKRRGRNKGRGQGLQMSGGRGDANTVRIIGCPARPPINFASPPIRKWVRQSVNAVIGSNNVDLGQVFQNDRDDYDVTAPRYNNVRVIAGRFWGPSAAATGSLVGFATILNIKCGFASGTGPSDVEFVLDRLAGDTRPQTFAWVWNKTDQTPPFPNGGFAIATFTVAAPGIYVIDLLVDFQ